MAEEEAQAPEENAAAEGDAQATEGEAAQAPEEAAPKPPGMLVPMLLSVVVSVGGAFAIVKFALPGVLEKWAKDNNGTLTIKLVQPAAGGDDHGKGGDDHGKGGDDHGKGGDDHGKGGDGHGGEEGSGASKTETKAGAPVPIVEEGEYIIVNPAGSTRYLMVEILMIRKNVDDNGFPDAVKENRKRLEAVVSSVLSAMSAEEMAEPSIRNGMPNQLKGLFQSILGSSHPIKSVIIPKWVMQ